MTHRFVALNVLLGVTLLFGCSGPSNIQPVSGSITLDGKPCPGLFVLFTPLEGEQKTSSRGQTDENGQFTLRYSSQIQGALIGKHLVQVSPNPDPGPGIAKVSLPPRYNRRSELRAEVTTDGDNTFQFDLTSGKK